MEAIARQHGDVTVVIESTPRFAERSGRLLGEARFSGLSRERGMPITVYTRPGVPIEGGESPGRGWVECKVGEMRLLMVHAIAPYLPWRISRRRGHLSALSERMSELANCEPALTIGDFNTAHFERAWRTFATAALDCRWHWLTHEEDHRPERRRGTWPFGSVWSPVALDHALGGGAARAVRSVPTAGADCGAPGHPGSCQMTDDQGMSMLNKFTALASIGSSSKGDNHRAFGRARADAVDCDRGQVIDLSRNGMRLNAWRPWVEGERRTLMLTGMHVGVTLTAKCVWVKRVSRFKHMMGLEFEGLNETTQAVVKELMHVAAPSVHDGWSSHKTEVDSIMDDMKSIDEDARKSA